MNKNINIKELVLGKFGIVICLVILCIVFGMLSPIFLSWGNISNILIQSGTNAIIAAGMTFVIIAGGIDLSVGSIVAISSVIGADVMIQTNNVLLGIFVTLLVGLFCGALNGVFISYFGFPAFIVTLSTMWLYRGIAYVITNGQAIVNLPEGNMNLALGKFIYLPYIVWLILIAYFICYLVLHHFTIGRKIYAIGDNAESARLSGVNVKLIRLIVFIVSGLMSSIGAIILMSRLNSGQPVAGQSFEMSAIAAAVIGGTSLTKGGVGSISGTLIGALFISSLLNGLVILNVTSFWQQVFMGIVVLIAIGVDRYRKIILNK